MFRCLLHRLWLLRRAKYLALILSLPLLLASPAGARDDLDRLEYDASSLSERGQAKESMSKIDEAITLAAKQKRPTELIERLKVKKTSLLLANKFLRQGYDATRELLSRRDQLVAEMGKDPEIGVEADEVLHRLMVCGAEKQSPEALKLARAWCESFPQFRLGIKDQVHTALFDCCATSHQWAEAREAAQYSIKDLGTKNPTVMARLYYAARMLHNDKEAAKWLEHLKLHYGHKTNSTAWCLPMANSLNGAGDYVEAMPYANRACADIAKIKVGSEGSYAVSECFASRATSELGLGKLTQAEADVRNALTGSVGTASCEYSANSSLLEKILRRENKKEEAEKVRLKRNVIRFQPQP